MINWSSGNLVIWSIWLSGHLVIWSICHLVIWTSGHLVVSNIVKDCTTLLKHLNNLRLLWIMLWGLNRAERLPCESLWYEFRERHYITLVKSFPNNKELGGGDTTGESQNAKTLARHSNVSDWDPVWVCERPTRPSKSVFFWQDPLCFVSSVLDCL